MRRHDIISGILFVLSIIDFALAAPVLLDQQKRRQASVRIDAAHIVPKDVTVMTTVWEKRGKESESDDLVDLELEDMWEKYINSLEGELDDWVPSAAHSPSSGSDPSKWLNHGSTTTTTNAVQRPPALAPDPDQDPSTANPNQLDDELWSYKGNDGQLHTGAPTSSAYASSGYASDEEFAKAHAPSPNHNPTTDSSSDLGPGSDYDFDYWMNSEDDVDHGHGPPTSTGAAETNVAEHLNELGQAREGSVEAGA